MNALVTFFNASGALVERTESTRTLTFRVFRDRAWAEANEEGARLLFGNEVSVSQITEGEARVMEARLKHGPNVFIDVDDTLVFPSTGQLKPGVTAAIRQMVQDGFHLYLWSGAGKLYAYSIAERNGVASYFDGFSGKPDVVIDDRPGTVLPHAVHNPTTERWIDLAEAIKSEFYGAPMYREEEMALTAPEEDAANAFYGHGGRPGQRGGSAPSHESGGANASEMRALRAKGSYKPATQVNQRAAEEQEGIVAKALGGHQSGDNLPFDVLTHDKGVEVKALISNANAKLTMHPDSLARKVKFARKNGVKAFTVAADISGSEPVYYAKRGVGSFRVSNMERVGGLKQLQLWFRSQEK